MSAMRRAGIVVAASLAAGAAQVAAQTCLKADSKAVVTIRGTLAVVNFVHPGNQSRQSAVVVRLARPVCADVTDIDDKVQRVNNIARVQLAGEFDARKARLLMNKRVAASGTLFGQHTAYHITPILLDTKSLEAAK
jgi:hypothetical protein